MNTRIQKIVDAVKKNGHDGIVISKGSDIKYLTGFTGEYGVAVLLLTERKNYFVPTDGLNSRPHRKQKDLKLLSTVKD